MNREIKFRAWDIAKKQWFKPVHEAYKGDLFDISIGLSGQVIERTININASIINSDNYILNQYTGLVDKNGVEIYEADFIGKKGAYVVWSERLSCWCFKFHNDEIETPLYHDDISKHEVIGNIYENPELLNK